MLDAWRGLWKIGSTLLYTYHGSAGLPGFITITSDRGDQWINKMLI
jgi:hypothetical protein